jgi:hypothetical protein
MVKVDQDDQSMTAARLAVEGSLKREPNGRRDCRADGG